MGGTDGLQTNRISLNPDQKSKEQHSVHVGDVIHICLKLMTDSDRQFSSEANFD